jgi:dTDP-4-amino-4,6-dideoxygalactose transaminase
MATQWRVPLFDTRFGPEEEEAVVRPLRCGWLSMGEEVLRLEEELCAATGARHALAVSSGTAALHLACAALGVGRGDEVLCPTLTFVADANCPRALGARVRLCESADADDWTVDPAALRAGLTARTRAVIVVHYGGFACRLEEILPLAEGAGVAVIEDCAHALFSRHRGRILGRYGRVGCFSFFSNKNATCGEGGALVTDDSALAERLRLLRSHGMTSLSLDRYRGRAFSYDVLCPGFNYRMDEMRAALLRVQLHKLPGFLQRRRALFARYVERLRGTALRVPFQGKRFAAELADTAIHLMPVLLPAGISRPAVMARLKEAGIQSSIHYPPVHTFTAYRGQAAQLPRTEALAERQLTLPLYPHMDHGAVDLVVDVLLQSLGAVKIPA